jgi:septal ring factor EnvC (AmiA/AmiB activator)
VIQTRCRALPAAIAAGLLLLPAHLPAATPEKPAANPQIAELNTLRPQCIAAAHTVQQKERALAALDLAVGVMERGAAAKQQQLDLNGKEEEQLLGALERLARAPPESLAFAPEGPIDRVRSGILIAAAVPALEAQAKTLAAQLATLAAERAQINARRPELDAARQALTKARDALTPLVAKRTELVAKLTPNDGKAQAIAKLGDQASDLFDLIKRTDAERAKDPLPLRGAPAAAKKGAPPAVDPTRPSDLRALDAPRATMLWPVMGDTTHRFGEADRYGRPSQGLTVSTSPSAVVVAPFDGQVAYAGNFRGYGLILIIRHAGGYHSLLAGLGPVDVTNGQWLLAGEPVGAMPGSDDKTAGVMFYLELRRDGRPVDPQSRLASRE